LELVLLALRLVLLNLKLAVVILFFRLLPPMAVVVEHLLPTPKEHSTELLVALAVVVVELTAVL
jgi:hypothetical protein